jgi:ribonuclease P protein component
VDSAPADAPARVGLVVGRSVGPAVVRNRVKRRLRALLRSRLDALPAGSVLVVRALPTAATAGSGALAADLDAGLSRLLPGVSR